MAFARLSGFFSKKGIDIGHIVPADYSPNNLHAERIRNADMVLDSDVCGQITAAIQLSEILFVRVF